MGLSHSSWIGISLSLASLVAIPTLTGQTSFSAQTAVTAPADSRSLPQAPKYYVLDEPHVLSPATIRALEELLVEHDRLTGQQIVFAIFNGLQGADPDSRTGRLFDAWKIGQRGKDDGILVALYWNDRKASIHVGYGLEDVLADDQTDEILKEDLLPALKDGQADRAVRDTARGILEEIDSPLVESGRDDQILGASDATQSPGDDSGVVTGRYTWLAWLVLGFVLLLIALNRIFTADAHFTGSGWFRPSPWRRRPLKDGTAGSQAAHEGGASAEW